MIRVLIAEDSPTDAAILKSIFESAPGMSVVGIARDGAEAVSLTEKLKPDIITMDIKMPKMDGYQAIDVIMRNVPTPIVVVSSIFNDSDSDATFKALEAGALTVLPKPVDISSPTFALTRRHMIDMIRSMSEIKVIKKRKISTAIPSPEHISIAHEEYHLIAIGSSVGGPQALKEIFSNLPETFSVPIIVVQHMTSGFITGFTKWMDSKVPLKVKFAEDNEILLPGHVYFAPDHVHMEVKRSGGALRAYLHQGEVVAGFRPSITVMMQSVAQVCGKHAIGILLTGMGSDGANGMLALKQNGSHTFIQDPDSCVVFGMASVAQTRGAVDKVVELDKIAEYLKNLTNNKAR
ncbi:MAG TPA: chemotaxis-specific protein-glutamate methyltransferase CheB [Gammaproteobacteria bacterium]|jgi:two-component system chemotaxis response regulator CheB|nr:chemotaxis-specific protein-glutamate methyltransferase CheB [Gammaproteobacteria bacterium]